MLPVLGITLVGAIIRFSGLGRQTFWIDEVVTAEQIAKPLGEMLASLPGVESTPPLYFVLAWMWARIAGADEVALRSLSALFGTAAIPVAYIAARTLLSRRVGLTVAALAAVNPLLVWYSQEARAYSLFVLTAALSLLFFARASKEATRRELTLWTAAAGLCMLTHYFAVFILMPQAVALLARNRHRATVVAVALVGAVGVVLLPLAAYQSVHAPSQWVGTINLAARAVEAVQQLLIPSAPSAWAGAGADAAPLWPLALALFVAATGAVIAWARGHERRGALVSVAIGLWAVACPLAIALVASLATNGRGDVFLYRNVIVAWLPLTFVLAAGIHAVPGERLRVTIAAAVVAWSAIVLVLTTTDQRHRRDDWRVIAARLDDGPQLLVLSPSWQRNALEHYVDGVSAVDAGGAVVVQVTLLARSTVPPDSPPVRDLVLPREFVRVRTLRVQHWLLTTYRAPEPVRVRSSDVRSRPKGASYVTYAKPSRTN